MTSRLCKLYTAFIIVYNLCSCVYQHTWFDLDSRFSYAKSSLQAWRLNKAESLRQRQNLQGLSRQLGLCSCCTTVCAFHCFATLFTCTYLYCDLFCICLACYLVELYFNHLNVLILCVMYAPLLTSLSKYSNVLKMYFCWNIYLYCMTITKMILNCQ